MVKGAWTSQLHSRARAQDNTTRESKRTGLHDWSLDPNTTD
jgi:hypothetical protein